MATSNGPKLGLLANGAQGDEHYAPLMARWRGLDSLVQANVLTHADAAPPSTPADGDTHIVGAAATGAWNTHTNKLARWDAIGSAWEFYTPRQGWRVWSEASDTFLYFNGTAWVPEVTALRKQTIEYSDDVRTLAESDFGNRVVSTALVHTLTEFVIPANAVLPLPVGAEVELYNEHGKGDFLYLSSVDQLALENSVDMGDMEVSPGAMATLIKVRSNRWLVRGPGVAKKAIPPGPGDYYLTFGPAILTDGRRTLSSAGAAAAAQGSLKNNFGGPKLYFEFSTTYEFFPGGNSMVFGLANDGATLPAAVGSVGGYSSFLVHGDGEVFISGVSSGWLSDGINNTKRMGLAVDMGEGKVWVSVNGVFSGDPATNTGGFAVTMFGDYRPTAMVNGSVDYNLRLRTLAADQANTPPAGFSAWDVAV